MARSSTTDNDTRSRSTLNAVEEWKIENWTFGPPISHPFHIHINPFQISEVFNPNQTVVNSKGRTVPKYVFYNDPATEPVQCYLDPERPDDVEGLQERRRYVQAAHLVGRVSDPVGHRRDRCERQSDQGCNGQQIMVPGYFRMRSRFVDFAGQYVLHCHILAHEDRGMMMMVQVSRARQEVDPTLYRHH